MQEVVNEVFGVLRGTFFSGDLIAILIAFGSVLVAALLMQRGSQIGSMTLLALVLFAIGGFLRGFFAGPDPAEGAEGGRAISLANSRVDVFLDMSAGTLLGYFVAFMILILVFYYVRQMVKLGN